MLQRLWLAISAIGLSLFGNASFAIAPHHTYNIAPGRAPIIAADDNGHLHAVFEGKEPGWKNQDIFYCQSLDGGVTWTDAEDLSNTPAASNHPDIAVELSGAIDVVWTDTRSGQSKPDVFFIRSNDGGKNWTLAKDISNTPGVSSEPDLAIAPDNSIHVVWCDTSKGAKKKDIYYRSSKDAGKSWGTDAATNISASLGSCSAPAIAISADSAVHVAWEEIEGAGTKPDIFYSVNENSTWIRPINASNSPGNSKHPALACGTKERVYLAWTDDSKKPKAPDVWCSIAKKRGQFAEPLNISDTPGVSSDPSIASDGKDHLCIVWTDTSKSVVSPDIFSRVSLDGGDDFSNVIDLSNTPGVSGHAGVSIGGDKVFAIWADFQYGKSWVKVASIGLEDLATGPPEDVEQIIHGVPSDSR